MSQRYGNHMTVLENMVSKPFEITRADMDQLCPSSYYGTGSLPEQCKKGKGPEEYLEIRAGDYESIDPPLGPKAWLKEVKEQLKNNKTVATAINGGCLPNDDAIINALTVCQKRGLGTYEEPLNIDHNILIVGYGKARGKQYLIIRNSYGPYWGESGYHRFAVTGTGGSISTIALCGLNSMQAAWVNNIRLAR